MIEGWCSAEPPERGERRTSMRFLILFALLAGLLLIATGCDDRDRSLLGVAVRGPEAADGGGPGFGVDEVEVAPLPEGWERCGAGPAEFESARPGWWSQEFGPAVDGSCDVRVTVTQLPSEDWFEVDEVSDDLKVGPKDALLWDDVDGWQVLFLWAVDQNLVVRGCCGVPRAVLADVALAAANGLREEAPARCTDPASDLSSEDLVTHLFARTERLFTADGCPVAAHIGRWATNADHHHCWPGVQTIVVGTPVGESAWQTSSRAFVRDPERLLPGDDLAATLDLDAALPASAVDTGLSRHGVRLFEDRDDPTRLYVVYEDHVEAWPLDRGVHGCA